jgi:acetoin utilization deacetylase AcuC-like enzyme
VLPECFPLKGLKKNCEAARLSKPPKDEQGRAGFYAYDMSAGISANTWTAALASANLAMEGARLIANDAQQGDRRQTILALCRPPGHHCTTSIAGGYCYINNSVVAVNALRHFTNSKLSKGEKHAFVTILDIDFHHGNGTQEAFYEDDSVLYVSIHGLDEYPYYSGFEDEAGSGKGKGYNFNLPLEAQSTVEQYLEKLDVGIRRMEEENPQYFIVSLGLDTFNDDPLGSFKIFTKDYATIASRIKSSKVLGNVPTLILLEGGYVVEHIGENMVSFLRGWENQA